MKIIKKILLFLLSIWLFSTIVSILVIISGKNLFTRSNLSNYIKDANILNMDIDVLFNLNENNITLKEKITTMALENNIPNKIVVDMMKSDEINMFLGDFFSKTIDYAVNNGDKPKISQDVIDEMNKVANISLENHINIMMSEEELKECISNYAMSLSDLVPERQELNNNFSLEIFKKFLDFNLSYLFAVVMFLLILIWILSKKFYKVIKHIGISMIISGIMFVTIGSMENMIKNIVINNFDVMDAFVVPLVINCLTLWFKYGVVVSFIGVFLYITYIVVNRITINNTKEPIL